MLSNILNRLQNVNRFLLNVTTNSSNTRRQLTSLTASFLKDSKESADKESAKIVITEDLPPIPPDLGFRGNDEHLALFEIQRINNTFKYG
jgi:hypothetical protein